MSTQDNKGSSEDKASQNLPVIEVLPETNIIELQKTTKVNLKELTRLNSLVPKLSDRNKGKLLDCTYDTVQRLNKKLDYIQGVTEHFKSNRADILAEHQRVILDSCMSDIPLKQVSFRDKMIAYGILSDKEYREREKGSTVQGLSQILKGIHIDMRKGTITVLSPFPSTPPDQESPRVGGDTNGPNDVVIDIKSNDSDAPPQGSEWDHGSG